MTALQKSVQFQLTCNLCRGSHKTQVWLCFLILSFLSTCHSAPSVSEIKDLRTSLSNLKLYIERSTAILYTPTVQFQDKCKNMILRCYMLELMVILYEEEIPDSEGQFIYHFNQSLSPEIGCPPCETYNPQNSETFFKSLKNVLEKLLVEYEH
ncbi:interleukin-15 isoform X2 [Nothobranchius furzeri]|uniref:interleukin-15 isoform X2 n=1 Tax=Nothobranchius furzeri TaxID=105023 RepID=UPI0024041178|nr:interleukin-15 isoform X2 [Nothobranchius furzeri]